MSESAQRPPRRAHPRTEPPQPEIPPTRLGPDAGPGAPDDAPPEAWCEARPEDWPEWPDELPEERERAAPARPRTQREPQPGDLDAALARLGYEGFRPGQREAIETLLGSGRALLVAPTGGGKSLCYQLPALVLGGTTLVVSPLIALMQDQVQSLTERGVRATFLASTVEASEARRRMARLARGEYELAYVAPERLALSGFRGLIKELHCPLIAVDEAHCISEWGHDFRPEYLEIGGLIQELSNARVLACTATATPLVRDEILTRLGLGSETPQIVRGFARPNLALRAQQCFSRRERSAAVDAALREALGSPRTPAGAAIVYAPTRRVCEEEAARLAGEGWHARAYHAGMYGPERAQIQSQFRDAALPVVVATNAFGMGIDRADVRAVLHLAPPASIEAYYQEVGRAGRDGEPALALLCLTLEDFARRRHWIERDRADSGIAQEIVEHKWGLFLELMRWAEGGACRHDAILRYFGDEAETLAGCGRCDVCTRLDAQEQSSEEETSEVVRKALSGVARMHRRFGLRAVIALLRGQSDARLQRSGLDRVSTFGVLREESERWLMLLLQRFATAGWMGFEGEDRPVVSLTESGRDVMRGRRPARILLPPRGAAGHAPAGSGRSGRGSSGRTAAGSAESVPLDRFGEERFELLRRCRQRIARELGVPAYVVAHDRTLRDVARLDPRSLSDLSAAWGLGPSKLERFGPALLEALRS